MRAVLAVAMVLVVGASTPADEGDDTLAKSLAGIVRDPRLRIPQRVEAARTLGKLGQRGGAAVPDLVSQLDRLRGREHEVLQEAVIDALGRIGSPARAALPSIVRTSGRSVDIDLAIRRATDQLLAASDSSDISALTQQLSSNDTSVRLRATKALGALGPAARYAVQDLIVVLNDRDADVRRAAVAALNAIQPETPPTEQVIRSIALDFKDPDPGVRILAIKSLVRYGRRAGIVVSDLEPLLTDADTDVRKAAADAMNRIGPP